MFANKDIKKSKLYKKRFKIINLNVLYKKTHMMRFHSFYVFQVTTLSYFNPWMNCWFELDLVGVGIR